MMISAILIACDTHWLTGLAFASPALFLPLALGTIAIVARRREEDQ